jgi:hypothetical protein
VLVTRVLGNCPGCKGNDCYGNVAVQGDHVLRGCKQCRFSDLIPLPGIRKKIIYLDQFFFSGAFRGGDQRFVKAAEIVKRMTHLQLLVSPYSSVHEDETYQWRGHSGKGHKQLMEFIKATSRGMEFKPAYEVEDTQLMKAFQAYLEGKPAKYVFETNDAVEGALDKWDDYFRIDVGRYLGDIELMRTLKSQAVKELINIFDSWQKSTQTFEQDIALEIGDAGKQYMKTYLQMLARIRNGDYDALFDSPIMATIVQNMLYCVPDDIPPIDRLNYCAQFFQSAHFAQVPNVWLSTRMFATLKDMVKRGSYANRKKALERLSGVFYDIKHISMYAPYCDAFIMDTPMADLVSKPEVGLEQRYGTRVFSLNNWSDLMIWLNDLEVGMTEEHKAGIAAAYP